jgi:hypothetical protein
MVKDAIQQCLSKLNPGFGYASGACGSDILFREVMWEMKGENYVILPYEKERFVRDCVEIVPGSDWGKRLEKVIAHAIDTQEVSKQPQMGSNVSYEFANLILHGLARVGAEQLETKLVPAAVWHAKSGTGEGGTVGAVERWRRLGLHLEVIGLKEILHRECPSLSEQAAASPATVSKLAREASSEFAPEIRALLFADAEGFSKLTDEEVPLFVQNFLGLAGELAAKSAHRPLTKNTWGDGLYFVFSNDRGAGQFALDLCDVVRNTDWSKHGLPFLNLRIGLHAGPAYSCRDPVTQQTTHVGANVSPGGAHRADQTDRSSLCQSDICRARDSGRGKEVSLRLCGPNFDGKKIRNFSNLRRAPSQDDGGRAAVTNGIYNVVAKKLPAA